jgi:hypothetical protein
MLRASPSDKGTCSAHTRGGWPSTARQRRRPRSDRPSVSDVSRHAVPLNALVILALSLIVPSIGTVQKYAGVMGLAAYIAAVGAGMLVAHRFVLCWLRSALSARLSPWLTMATVLAAMAVFAVVYPLADAGVVGGGTDRDDALNIAARELLHGRYPYYPKTYLQAPITPLPGSVLLATPFVLLGNSAYQNLFWISACSVLLASYLRDLRAALLVLWTVLIFSPLFWQELVTGGDLLANSLFVCAFTLLTVGAHESPASRPWQRTGAVLLLGVGLASRPNYLLVLVPVCSLVWQVSGRRSAITSIALVCVTTAGLTVPFYLSDPAGFSPLHAFRRLNQFDALLPFSGWAIIALSGLVAVRFALCPLRGHPVTFLLACALPQAIPIIAGLIFDVVLQRPNDTLSGYGLSFMWFGVLAAWVQIVRNSHEVPGVRRPDRSLATVLR